MSKEELVAKIKAINPSYAAHVSWSQEDLELHLYWLERLPALPSNIGKRGRTRFG